ncbi:MAG: superoxide dismutase family protein [Burkholderiales bacterium]|nr:superoxide dismutase family protein [Burkholderiales bacterium]
MQRPNRILVTAAMLAAGAAAAPAGAADARASAVLAPTQGNAVAGTVTFEQRGDRVVVTAEITGLKPGSQHGFHVHEKGDCSAPDATSAGGHFNPGGKPHGHHASPERHGGDLPNLVADEEGRARYTAATTLLTVAAGPASVVGRGVVVHRDPDDYKSQPAGNSGPRIACGVIRAGG